MIKEKTIGKYFLRLLQTQYGYPSSLIVEEVALNSLPHMEKEKKIPHRRVDAIVYGKGKESLTPLVLVEFKVHIASERALEKTLRQAEGYNSFVRAPYIFLVDAKQAFFFHQGRQLKELPHFTQLSNCP